MSISSSTTAPGAAPGTASYHGSQITTSRNGTAVTFDVPSWISINDFNDALTSTDPTNPLTFLTECTFIRRDKGMQDANEDVFRVKWLVPLNTTKNLLLPIFMPAPRDANGWEEEWKIDQTSGGILLTTLVREYSDCNDGRLYFYEDTDDNRERILSEEEQLYDGDRYESIDELREWCFSDEDEYSDIVFDGKKCFYLLGTTSD